MNTRIIQTENGYKYQVIVKGKIVYERTEATEELARRNGVRYLYVGENCHRRSKHMDGDNVMYLMD